MKNLPRMAAWVVARGHDLGKATGWWAIPYSSLLYQTLAIFRFFSFSIGASILLITVPLEYWHSPDVALAISLGVFNVVRVVYPPSPAHRLVRESTSTAAEVAITLALILSSGGLNSPFLVHSLTPVLAASLFLNVNLAAASAAVLVTGIVGAHAMAPMTGSALPGLMTGNHLGFAILYAVGCAFVAFLPFQANLNSQRRLQVQAKESERARLRRDVHDEVAQTLAFLSMKLQRADERSANATAFQRRDIDDIKSGVQRCYLAVRDYLDDSADSAVDHSLAARLLLVGRQWRRDTGLPLTVSMSGTEPVLPTAIGRHLTQIAREALANVARHARPSSVLLRLDMASQGITLKIRDDGTGFSPNQSRGVGLNSMHERAAIIGASLVISSAPQQGTEVVVVYPSSADGGT